jgi:hypothetical protein
VLKLTGEPPILRIMRLPRLVRVFPLAVLVSCSKLASLTSPKAATDTSTIAAVNVVQGDNQSGQAGRALSAQVVLRIVDAKGKGVPHQPVTLAVTTGGGAINPPTVVSDSSGELHLTWTLGTASVVQTITATVDGLDPVVVNATAIFPSVLILAQGGAQTAKFSTALKNDVVVRVQGANGVPMVGISVTFRVTQGGGAITPQSGITNSAGETSAKWTLGATVGSNVVVAESGVLTAVSIGATATP